MTGSFQRISNTFRHPHPLSRAEHIGQKFGRFLSASNVERRTPATTNKPTGSCLFKDTRRDETRPISTERAKLSSHRIVTPTIHPSTMISGTTTIMLRSGVARTCGIQPQAILLRTSTTTSAPTPSPATTGSAHSYATFPASPFSSRSKLPSAAPKPYQPRPSVYLLAQTPAAIPSHARSASNKSAHEQDAAAAKHAAERAAANAAASVKSGGGMPPLDWNAFFQLRKSRRRWQVAGSAAMSLASGATGVNLLASRVADPLTAQIPLDPILSMGLMTIGFLALGWLVGPTLGNTIFYLLNRKYKAPMTLVSLGFSAPHEGV